jgi:Ca2+ transporting ATPase
MCTGDNIDTATAISKNAGIVTQADIDAHKEWTTMTGEKFRETVGVLKYVTDPKDPEK